MQAGVLLEQGRELVVQRGRGHCRRRNGRHLAQPPRERRGAHHRHHRDPLVEQHRERLGLGLLARRRDRAAEKIALAEADAEVAHHPQVIGFLDALGDQRGAEDLGDLHQRTQGLQLLGVAAQVGGEVLVDLDDVGLQLRPEPQAGAAVAEVVEREHHAGRMQLLGDLAEAFDVAHMFVFGDLDHQHARLEPELAHGLANGVDRARPRRLQQGRGAHVHEQPARLRQRRPLAERRRDAGDLEVEQQALFARGGDQRIGRVQRHALGAADQRFVRVDHAVAEVDDGLKHRRERVGLQQPRERPGAVAGAVGQHVGGRRLETWHG